MHKLRKGLRKCQMFTYGSFVGSLESVFIVQNQEYFPIPLVEIQITIICILEAIDTNKLDY